MSPLGFETNDLPTRYWRGGNWGLYESYKTIWSYFKLIVIDWRPPTLDTIIGYLLPVTFFMWLHNIKARPSHSWKPKLDYVTIFNRHSVKTNLMAFASQIILQIRALLSALFGNKLNISSRKLYESVSICIHSHGCADRSFSKGVIIILKLVFAERHSNINWQHEQDSPLRHLVVNTDL